MNRSVSGWIKAHSQIRPHHPAVIEAETERVLTYSQLYDRINGLTHYLRNKGLVRGDRIALLATNGIAFLEVTFAANHLGIVVVPLNYRLTPHELSFMLNDAEPKLLFASEDLRHLASDALQVSKQTIDIVDIPKAQPDSVFNADWDQLVGRNPSAIDVDVSESDVAMIMYSSGTTGSPKGVVLSHGNMQWSTISLITSPVGMTRDDVALVPMPLFHVGGLGVTAYPILHLGGTIVIQNQFDAETTINRMHQYNVTHILMVPTMWENVLALPEEKRQVPPTLRVALSAAAPTAPHVFGDLRASGWPMSESYGMTEMAPSVSALDPTTAHLHPGSIGRPMPHVDVRVIDPDGNDVESGEVGELITRGPNRMIEYFKRPADTERAIWNGWYRTGDLAYMDKDGYLFLVDRLNDMIISGGENIYPVEVENTLKAFPGVVDAAVIGRLDSRWGEVPTAFIVISDEIAFDTTSLKQFCLERIAKYKCPAEFRVVQVLPRNASGKLLKRDLRAIVEDETYIS